MEEVILVDSDDRELGSAEKLRAHEEGLLHRAFSVFIFSSDGRMLLQRRALDKYHSAGLYTNACCSHPRPGEQTIEAAHRRLQEEMGFDCGLEYVFPLVYRADLDHGLVENEYDHVFVGRHDGEIHHDPSEVDEYQWIEPDRLKKWMNDKPDDFTVWFSLSAAKVMDEYRGEEENESESDSA